MVKQQKDGQADTATKTRRRRPAEELMDGILQAAACEFKKNGYSGSTAAAIARAAGVTEAQIFRYFKSKADLFRSAIFDPLDKQLLHFSETHSWGGGDEAGDGNLRDERYEYVENLQSFLGDNIEYIASLVHSQYYGSEDNSAPLSVTSLDRYFARGASVLSSQNDKAARVRPDLMVRVSFAAVLGCVMFKDWIFPESLASEAEIRQAIDDFVLDGLGASYSDLPPSE